MAEMRVGSGHAKPCIGAATEGTPTYPVAVPPAATGILAPPPGVVAGRFLSWLEVSTPMWMLEYFVSADGVPFSLTLVNRWQHSLWPLWNKG
jgi:hypothetical protein